MNIGIGIDTGGTYTDAVIYDFENKKILGTAKALTTKEDLSSGILEVLDQFSTELLQAADAISLSTTLATNACVEDKGGSAKLVFFGGDSKIIDELGKAYGLPASEDIYIQESFTTFSGEILRELDWDLFSEKMESEFQGFDGLGIVESNAIKNSGVIEKKAKELLLKTRDVPVVCGHELFNELNSLQRASSTLLNARLLAVIQEFITAIKSAMEKRDITAPIVIVRSDGSLMSEDFARTRPVETLLCGPAASVMGSSVIADETNSVVVDMGGTTTDIAIIKNSAPLKVVDGIRIGKWKTFVDGLYIKTFGLGGDTAIHYDAYNGKVFLEDYRVVPLCVAASKYPQVTENLNRLISGAKKHTRYLFEHYILVRDISENSRYTKEEKIFCTALKDGPLILSKAAEYAPGQDIYNMGVERLLREGVVQVCGLTPTDIMHIKGDFIKFDAEASRLGVIYASMNTSMTIDGLCDFVYDEIKRKLYVNIVKSLLENEDEYYFKKGVEGDLERAISESYKAAKAGAKNEFITMGFKTGYSLTGVGAPIKIFLDDVARMLGTKAVIPEHYEVANALGAIVGNIHATSVIQIRPSGSSENQSGYLVFGRTETKSFLEIDEAEEFALAEAGESARSEAEKRGAKGEIAVTCKLKRKEVDAYGSMMYLGAEATALAVGSLGL